MPWPGPPMVPRRSSPTCRGCRGSPRRGAGPRCTCANRRGRSRTRGRAADPGGRHARASRTSRPGVAERGLRLDLALEVHQRPALWMLEIGDVELLEGHRSVDLRSVHADAEVVDVVREQHRRDETWVGTVADVVDVDRHVAARRGAVCADHQDRPLGSGPGHDPFAA